VLIGIQEAINVTEIAEKPKKRTPRCRTLTAKHRKKKKSADPLPRPPVLTLSRHAQIMREKQRLADERKAAEQATKPGTRQAENKTNVPEAAAKAGNAPAQNKAQDERKAAEANKAKDEQKAAEAVAKAENPHTEKDSAEEI
jgi:hypothetical protein